jgi:tRNA G18 (ribose-2'-O)-methylase SpoU
LIAAADEQVTIPMSDDSLDSLNVAASAAIVMSEVVRQRNAGASQ